MGVSGSYSEEVGNIATVRQRVKDVRRCSSERATETFKSSTLRDKKRNKKEDKSTVEAFSVESTYTLFYVKPMFSATVWVTSSSYACK